jgi:hypothetical protein
MSDTIIAALITGLCTASPMIYKFLQGIAKSSKIVAFKKGFKFQGVWKNHSSGEVYTDEIIVDCIRLGKIICTGNLLHNGSPKSYKLIGKQYGWCITFEYLGTENGQHDETAGVVILDKTTPKNTLFNGRWSQLTVEGKLIGGEVTFSRIL